MLFKRQFNYINTISARLFIWMLFIALIPLAVLSLTNYYVSQKDISDQANNNLARTVELAAQTTDN